MATLTPTHYHRRHTLSVALEEKKIRAQFFDGVGGVGEVLARTSLRKCEKGSDRIPKQDLPEAESKWVTQNGKPAQRGAEMPEAKDEDFFAQVRLEEVELFGQRFRFPIRYYDHQRISAAFPASATEIQRVLPSARLKPVQPEPGIAFLRMTGYEYYDIDGLAPYNEFSFSVPVLYEKGGSAPGLPGNYVIHLPVTTEEARRAGVELYGYPKFLAEITFEDSPDVRRCRIRADGTDLVTLTVARVSAGPESADFYAYTVKNKKLLRTLVQVQGEWGTNRVRGGASFVLGDHPIARKLRGLEIGQTSLEHTHAPKQKMFLHLPGESLPL